MNATPESIIKPRTDYPPMLQQYLDYKDRFPDCLIFFQVGDFYELFFDDAVTCARAINLTLTSRDKNSPNPIPMCGVPISVGDQYCERLVDLGHSVAIVSQVGAPTGKGMVARKLERIITPAVKVLAGVESADAKGMVAAVFIRSEKECAISCSAVQTGQILVKDGLTIADLAQFLAEYSICELVLPGTISAKTIDRRTSWVRVLENKVLNKNIKFRPVSSQIHKAISSVSGFTDLSPTAKLCVSMLGEYIDEVTVEAEFQFLEIKTATEKGRVFIDPTTRINLELTRNSRDGTERGTLYEYLNETKTLGGARLLRQELVNPLAEKKAIENRLDLVEKFINGFDSQHDNSLSTTENIQLSLKKSLDLERIATRIELSNITPKEVGALRDFLLELTNIHECLGKIELSDLLAKENVEKAYSLGQELETQLSAEPPFTLVEGGIFNPENYPELKELIEIQENSKTWLSELETKEKELTGISSLKIKYTSVFGFFIEVSNSQLSKIPDRYTRKQTTTNSERFITAELKERESQILGADDKRINLEKKLFISLKEKLQEINSLLRDLHGQISHIDFIVSLAEVAIKNRLVRPMIADQIKLKVDQGRHPQLAKILQSEYIPNDCNLDVDGPRVYVLTGPNMGGKSTYLRQIAIITILAHLGSYVPANRATIGLVDKVFARLGASDNIAEGESTFMVEMREAANLINTATEKSLLVIDEIGRGTSTKDGLSIAQSILEWIVTKLKARALFATHFHEITELDKSYDPLLKNISVGSVVADGGLIFTHQIIDGPATRSFGIEVARRAGLPVSLLSRAQKLLSDNNSSTKQLSLFSLPEFNEEKIEQDLKFKKISDAIEKIEPDLLTPRDALNVIYELKTNLKDIQKS